MTIPRYAVFADDPTDGIQGSPIWCDTEREAITIMDEMTQESGFVHFIMERIRTAYPPEPIPTHEYNGVRPGVHFPATLGPERG